MTDDAYIIAPGALGSEDKEVPLTIEKEDGTRPVIGTATVHPDGRVDMTLNPKMIPPGLIEKIMPERSYSIEPRQKFIEPRKKLFEPEPEIEYKRYFEDKPMTRTHGLLRDLPIRNPQKDEGYIGDIRDGGPIIPLNKFACTCPWNNGYHPEFATHMQEVGPRHHIDCPVLMGEHSVGDKCGPMGHTNFESDMEGPDAA